MSELTVTSLEQLQEYAKGQLVELPPFAEGQAFVARLRRPSILALAKSGKIPNELLSAAGEMFNTGASKTSEQEDDKVLFQMEDLLETICEASFVFPTYAQIKEMGLELTDEQKTFVFQYAQNGVKALTNFRTK